MSKTQTNQLRNSQKSRKNDQIVGGDFNAELGPGIGVERLSVKPHTLKETNKRGDWMKQWLMLQKFVAISTTFRKTHQKRIKFRTREGVEKQLDYILVIRKNLKHSRDTEANDMIHIGSDQRSVMEQFVIPAATKDRLTKKYITWREHGSSQQIWEA